MTSFDNLEWVENPGTLRTENGSILRHRRLLTRAQARQLSRSRRVIESDFPYLTDVTDDSDRIGMMLSNYADAPTLFTYTASLYSGDDESLVVFDCAH